MKHTDIKAETIAKLTKKYEGWDVRDIINETYSAWLDQITIRGHSKWGSARYNNADERAEAIEDFSSMLVFGDTAHTMTECYSGEENE